MFLDFDGTLVPITGDPAAPRLSAGVTTVLKQLSSRASWVITIISGRSICDLRERIGLEGLIYAGNHGLEICGHGLQFVEPVAAAWRAALERLADELALAVDPIPGTMVEYKGLTASVHYRQAAATDWPLIERTVAAAAARAGDAFSVQPGRKVFDIVPRTNWHKGAAVQWINSHLGNRDLTTIYLGDDASDENAFAVLPDAITIKIGTAGLTAARYRVPDPAAVHDFLYRLAQ